jgi:hypothetical protein
MGTVFIIPYSFGSTICCIICQPDEVQRRGVNESYWNQTDFDACSGIMILTLAPRSRQEINHEIKLLRRNAKKIFKTKASGRKFLIDHGFITKAGKLTKKYGG